MDERGFGLEVKNRHEKTRIKKKAHKKTKRGSERIKYKGGGQATTNLG